MLHLHVVLVLPPEPETEEEKRDAQCEVVKPHVEQVVIGKRETEPSERVPTPSCFAFLFLRFSMNGVQEIEEGYRYHPDGYREEDLLGDDRGKHVEQQHQRDMRQPVRKNRDVEFPGIAQFIVCRFRVFLQHEAVVDMTRSVL